METRESPLLEVTNVTVERPAGLGGRRIGLRGVSFEVYPGEILVLAGETGSGKSLIVRLIAGAAGPKVTCLAGTIHFEERNLLGLNSRALRKVRGGPVAMVPGVSGAPLNPDRTVRQWLRDFSRMAGRGRGLREEKTWDDYFYRVGILEPERVLGQLPGDLSPLTVKRLLVMRAIMAGARLLICDEPGADLDPITRKQFLKLLRLTRDETGMGILLSSGSLRGVEVCADHVAVFFDGAILESGAVEDFLREPRFAYTREFRACDHRPGDFPRELPVISREAVREAEEAIHERASSLAASPTKESRGKFV